MEKIQNRNCEGMCNEKSCNSKNEYFEIIRINELDIMVSLCERHADEWDNNLKI